MHEPAIELPRVAPGRAASVRATRCVGPPRRAPVLRRGGDRRRARDRRLVPRARARHGAGGPSAARALCRSPCSPWRAWSTHAFAAGARAAIAAALGALALEGAGLAIADARAVGARGEDWTGFLLLPVGLVLARARRRAALALAEARPVPLPPSRARSRSRRRWRAYCARRAARRSGSSPRTAHVRPSSPPSSGGRTRR